MRHSQVFPGYPHSSAGAYASCWTHSSSFEVRVTFCIAKCLWNSSNISLFVHFWCPERICCSGVVAFGQTWIIPAKILVVHHFFVIINTGCSLIVASILGKVKWLTKVNVMEADYVEIPNLQENWACKNRAWEQGYKKQYVPIKFSSLLPCT